MQLSTKIKEMIKTWEGFCPKAMKCPAGVWTIGYGHTQGVKPGQTMTRAEADALFEKEIAQFAKLVEATIGTAKVNNNQFDALVSFAYNCGVGALQRSTLLRKVKANPEDPTIRMEFAKYVRGGGKVLPGLVKRRTAEANHYFAKS